MNNKKLKNYPKLVELANKELLLMKNSSNIRRGIFNEELLRRASINKLIVKYRPLLNEEELTIFELNLHVKDNEHFYTSLNNLSKSLYDTDQFRTIVRAKDNNKLLTIINKMSEYHRLDKKIIIMKIQEVLLYEDEVIAIQKKKIR